MEAWAAALQRNFALGPRDKEALAHAVDACPDPDIRALLLTLNGPIEQSIKKGQELCSRLASQGLTTEAVVLELTVFIPYLMASQNASLVPVGEREGLATLLLRLSDDCRREQELTPSLAVMLELLARFRQTSRDFVAAREAFEEALQVRRRLAADDPSTYQSDLAKTLNNLGNCYRETLDFASARETYEEARQIYAVLAAADPREHQNDLAMTHNNLGIVYSIIHDFAAAREAFEEARQIRRGLAADDSRTYQADLASTLHNLGNLYATTRDFASALEAYGEARQIYAELSTNNPRAYQSNLAGTLQNLGNLYRTTRDFSAARRAYNESREIYARLAAADPQVYQIDLALTLNNLGNLYSDTRDFATAQAVYEEARQIYAKLTAVDPQIYQTGLAMTLNNLGNLYSETRNFAMARGAYDEAHEIRRRLATADPETYQNDLAETLNNLGNLYSEIRNFNKAREAYEEARQIHTKLAAADPRTYQSDLALTLNNLGNLYRTTRDFPAAREAHEVACQIRRRVAADDPGIYQGDLALTLHNLGAVYSDTGDLTAALGAYEEAREIRRRLAAADPQTYQSDLAGTLNNLGNIYGATREFAAALEAYKEAREIRRRLAVADPQTYQNDLAGTLSNLGNFYRASREFAAALKAYEEAREIFAGLAAADPQTYQSDLAGTLNNLGNLYRDVGDFAAAVEAYGQAIQLAEGELPDETQIALNKDSALAAYQALLAVSKQDPAKAFILAATLRDAQARSREIDDSQLAAMQASLVDVGRVRGRHFALLVPTTGAEADTPTLGLIGEADCQWFQLSTSGWDQIFPAARGQSDHRARQRLAREIWESLPKPVREALLPRGGAGPTILISGDTSWSTFPWELLRFGDGEDDHLGLHHALPRVGSILAPQLRQQLAAERLGTGAGGMALVAPHTTGIRPLYGVLDEVEAIRARVPPQGLVISETGDAAHDGLLRSAIRKSPDILYFSGHGTVISNEELLVLHTDRTVVPRPPSHITYFGAFQLDEMAKALGDARLLPNAPLVVLNSCYTGRTRAFGGRREDLVDAFLRHGAGAVVSTSLPIYDSVGEALGRALFSDDAARCPDIGSLMVTARRELALGHCRDVDSPQWGAWGMIHLHGNGGAAPPFRHQTGLR